MRLTGADVDAAEPAYGSLDVERAQAVLDQASAISELSGDLALDHEAFDKVRSLETKLEYQIKKLIGLADASEKQESAAVEEDPLSFRPNPSALLAESSRKLKSRPSASGANDDADAQVYRPPRVAAVSYEGDMEKRQRNRRAPALLSEFASTLDGAPVLESTSGLATRPVQHHKLTNSASAKRAAELKRMDEFEEDNMTRLVTSKREAKRRREDEEALALGYGVGGPARGRGRRQNGLEAELEGVLGDRGSKGVWEGVRETGRGSALQRGSSKAGGGGLGAGPAPKAKKQRFERDVKRRK